jgi:hypothetical protein
MIIDDEEASNKNYKLDQITESDNKSNNIKSDNKSNNIKSDCELTSITKSDNKSNDRLVCSNCNKGYKLRRYYESHIQKCK